MALEIVQLVIQGLFFLTINVIIQHHQAILIFLERLFHVREIVKHVKIQSQIAHPAKIYPSTEILVQAVVH